MMRSKRGWIIVISLVVIAIVAFKFSQKQRVAEEGVGNNPVISSPVVSRPVISSTVIASGSAKQTTTYTQLVSDYADRRIQFDMRCQAIPASTTYKNNTKIMFDNRSGDARVITIGGVKYDFTGYGYKILNISGKSLPASISFDCGAAVNVGNILIQN